MIISTLILVITASMTNPENSSGIQSITKNGMTFEWFFQSNTIQITLKAPTRGWVAIGFNTSKKLQDTYLIMGRVKNDQTEVVEFYVHHPGKYTPIETLADEPHVLIITGKEVNDSTQLSFSLPIHSTELHQKDLLSGYQYFVTMAFSTEDDFYHHSIMRTNSQIIL